MFEDLITVHRRQNNIEQDEIRDYLLHALEALRAVADERDLETFDGELLGKHVSEEYVVFDYEYSFFVHTVTGSMAGSAITLAADSHGISIKNLVPTFSVLSNQILP